MAEFLRVEGIASIEVRVYFWQMDSTALQDVRLHNTVLNAEFVRYAAVTVAALVVIGFLWVKRLG